ncbi:hypothetical protein KP509_22G077400 [Ceratopteris richardii]|uniref:Uncharacterized protein n=1 Tax=Ceratopteris richardii TaxID=49495 RepID=A0A8T2S9G1_CERRI|nr:hypothetical protein KP509_22G077400 [Ceratopteris richardii]
MQSRAYECRRGCPILNYIQCWCCEKVRHIAKFFPRVFSPLDFVPACTDCGKKRLCEHMCRAKVEEVLAKEVSTSLATFFVDAKDNESLLASVLRQLECLREEGDNERIKIEKLEENQVKMVDILGTWEKQIQALKSKNKELKANKSLREGLASSDNENVVLDLRNVLMIADCHNVAIKEDSPKYDDDLAQRVDRMEREIKKLQEMTGRYDDQAGKMAEEFHSNRKNEKCPIRE